MGAAAAIVGRDTAEPVREHQQPHICLYVQQILLFIAGPLVYYK
jgi:hypothetical protein